MPERTVPPGVADLMNRRRKAAEPNAIATYQPQELETVGADDVLDVSWAEVKRVLEETITTITHEGGLEDVKVSEAVLLISVALRDLASEEELVRRALERVPANNILTYLQAVLPGKVGTTAREAVTKRWQTEKDSAAVGKVAKDIKELRLALAGAIDEGIHNKLMQTDPDYQTLQERGRRIQEDQHQARAILAEVKDFIRIRDMDPDMRGRIKLKEKPQSSAWANFYRDKNLQPKLATTKDQPRADRLVSGLDVYIEKCEGELVDLRSRLQHLRDVEKRRIYSSSSQE